MVSGDAAPGGRIEKARQKVIITIDFRAREVPCALCGWLDDCGGVEFTDDQQVRKVFCRQCTIDLVRACLPDAPFGSRVTKHARATGALAIAEA